MLSGNNRIAIIVGVVILIGIGFLLFNNNSDSSDSMSASSADPIAVIETTYGTIIIQLFPDVAPGHQSAELSRISMFLIFRITVKLCRIFPHEWKR